MIMRIETNEQEITTDSNISKLLEFNRPVRILQRKRISKMKRTTIRKQEKTQMQRVSIYSTSKQHLSREGI